MNYREMERLCNTYGIHLDQEMRDGCYQRIHYDNRPLWKKDMDIRMGKPVDFNTQKLHAPNISADRIISLVGNRAAVFAEKVEELEMEPEEYENYEDRSDLERES